MKTNQLFGDDIGARKTTIMTEKSFFFRQDRLQKEEIQKTLSPKGTGLDLSEKISYNQ